MKLEKKNYKIMQNFGLKNIPNLDTCVLGALEFFSDVKLPKISLGKYKKFLVAGSGNALATGKIIFKEKDAVFADESAYKQKLKNIRFDLAFLISSSGGKHTPKIAKYLKSKKIKIILLTNNKQAPAGKYAYKVLFFPKQREPYTYNTSAYLSMILSKTKENPQKIYEHVKKIEKLIPGNLSKYNAVYIILPQKFIELKEMFETKFDELFGPMITTDIYTEEQTKHAKTLVQSKKELFISFGEKNKLFGYERNRLNIPLPKNSDFGLVMAVGYYIIGKIQGQNKSFFKNNLVGYTKKVSKIFEEKINPIVE